MKIHLSNQGNLRNFKSFVNSIDLADSSNLDITVHNKWITVHPANLVIVAALAKIAGKKNSKIIGNIPDTGLYLDQMGLFNFIATESPFKYKRKESSGRFIPLTVIKTQDDQSKFVTDMVPLLHLSEESANIINYVISELVRNVLEHSNSSVGAIVAAQYYKKTNRISIAICDTGMGVWKSMNESWHPKTDLDAILLGLAPGITGTTRREGGSSENAGAGLFFIKSIASITRNYFAIYSGKAEYTLLKRRGDLKNIPELHPDPTKDRHTSTSKAPDFNGTLVAIDISLDETPEFKSLLSLIGNAYDDAIRNRKRMKYKEPKFV